MPKKPALGRGLDKIITDKYDSQALDLGDKSRVVELKITDVEPNGDQPRKNFNNDKLEELARSIEKHGVIQPIIVTKVGKVYQIVAGERRWRASKLAGLGTIPAIVRDYNEIKVMEVALIENLQREELNPVEESFGYKALMDNFSMTQEKISERVGKSRSAIANSLRLLNLPEKVLALLENGGISTGHAKVILGVSGEKNQIELAECVADKQLSVRETEKLVKDKSRAKKGTLKLTEEIKRIIKEQETVFSKALGTKVKIKDANGKGKIEISYFSHEEFERLAELLKNQ